VKTYRKIATVEAFQATTAGFIDTLEGRMSYKVGDYICKGAEGEQWPVKKSIFESTYEEVPF
jgi:uncharacterized protein affecting Mg2+/Co2+ transport